MPDIMTRLDWKMYDGASYLWSCYGPNCRFIDSKPNDLDHDTWHVSIIFDTKTLNVMEISGYGTVWNKTDLNLWIWRDPDYQEAYLAECKTRKVRPNMAWDEVDYQQINNIDSLYELLKMTEIESI